MNGKEDVRGEVVCDAGGGKSEKVLSVVVVGAGDVMEKERTQFTAQLFYLFQGFSPPARSPPYPLTF
jgi:hypothetical protein